MGEYRYIKNVTPRKTTFKQVFLISSSILTAYKDGISSPQRLLHLRNREKREGGGGLIEGKTRKQRHTTHLTQQSVYKYCTRSGNSF